MVQRRIAMKALAKVGYDAYGDAAGWENHIGKPMPKWEDLPEAIRAYWEVAAEAIVENSHVVPRASLR
jgi:hypothetical protein